MGFLGFLWHTLFLKIILKRVLKTARNSVLFFFQSWLEKCLKCSYCAINFIRLTTFLIQICFLVSVQNGSIHQKDAVNDDDFEPYLSSQTNQVSFLQIQI